MRDLKSFFNVPVFLALSLVLGAIFAAGCVQNSGKDHGTGLTPAPVQKITVTGSTTVLPLADRAKEEFEKIATYADIQITGGGSSVGVKAAGEGTAQIGMSSRDLKPEEKSAYPDLVKHTIAYDAILIIVHPSNPIESLALDQIRGIYNGTFTNWKQVGGEDRAIVVVGRDSASGTREYFHEAVMKKENFTQRQEELNSNGGIQQKVMQTPGAIGYVGLAFSEGVKAVKIDVQGKKVEPTLAEIKAGNYPLSRPLFMLTKGQPTGLAKEYIDFILSLQGQKIVVETGFVPLK